MVIVVSWFICAIIGAVIGSSRNRGFAGFLLGAILGPIGIIIVLLLEKKPSTTTTTTAKPDAQKKCPFCAELIMAEALVCKHCGRDLPPADPLSAVEVKSTLSNGDWKCLCGRVNHAGDIMCPECLRKEGALK